jgi:uncharacterized protein (TIGR01777 family)
MRVLITGATGLIGNALGQELAKLGHEINVLVRDTHTARERLSFPCHIFPWPSQGELTPAAFEKVEAVIHLAGENVAGARWSKERKEALRLSRIHTAKQLKDSVKSSLTTFIGASAIGFYGDRKDEELTEDSAAGSGFLSELCQDWETSSLAVPAKRHVLLRFGVVLSPKGGFLRQVVPMFRQFGASVIASGQQYFSWIHLHDAVQLIVKALMDSKIQGAVNAVAPQPISNRDVTNFMAEALKVIRAPAVPALALRLLYGELSDELLSSKRVLPKRALAFGFNFKYPDMRSALQEIYPDLEVGEMRSVFEIWLPATNQKMWEFFSDEMNLERITPPILNFKVLGKSTPQIEKGTLIDYKLKVRGLPVKWRTRITEWSPMTRFADEQLKGPYTKWYHVHEFQPMAGGIFMRDTVSWKLPVGALGRFAATRFVMGDVEGIFTYRAKVVTQLFFQD